MDYIIKVLTAFWDTLKEMSPYLLLGFAVAGVLSVFISPNFVRKHLGGRGWRQILKASLVGVPMPLCSCSVIPVAASLGKYGAGRGSVISFLIATPQIGVDSVIVTSGMLGPVFALFRVVAAFVSGILGGVSTEWVHKKDEEPIKVEDLNNLNGSSSIVSKLFRAVKYGFYTLPRDLGWPLLAGLFVAALISAFLPPDVFGKYVGSGILAMLIMMALGIPVYVCATASVPIAVAMLAKGVSAGAVLVFLMTGPATNAASIAMVWKMFGKKAMAAYLSSVAFTALLAGWALDFTINAIGYKSSAELCEHGAGGGGDLWAIAMLAIFGFSILKPIFSKKKPACCHGKECSDNGAV